MSAAPQMWKGYLTSFVSGAITAGLFYVVVDALDMGYISPGWPTAAAAGGVGAIAGPYITMYTGNWMA